MAKEPLCLLLTLASVFGVSSVVNAEDGVNSDENNGSLTVNGSITLSNGSCSVITSSVYNDSLDLAGSGTISLSRNDLISGGRLLIVGDLFVGNLTLERGAGVIVVGSANFSNTRLSITLRNNVADYIHISNAMSSITFNSNTQLNLAYSGIVPTGVFNVFSGGTINGWNDDMANAAIQSLHLGGTGYNATWLQPGQLLISNVPEPSVYALVGGAVALGFALVVRRRKRK